MNKIIRFYNQNRKEFWITVTVIIFIFAIIQLLNNIAKIQNQKDQQANHLFQEEVFQKIIEHNMEIQ